MLFRTFQFNILLDRVRLSSMLGIRLLQRGHVLPSSLRINPRVAPRLACACSWDLSWTQPHPCPPRGVLLFQPHWLPFGFQNTLHPLLSRPQGLCTCLSVHPECPLVTSFTIRCFDLFQLIPGITS